MPSVHICIKGKVQGVFYRVTAKEIARKIGLTGWIRNTPSGDVEAVATGEVYQIRDFIEWCKEGPEDAIVENVITTDIPEKEFETFSVKRQE